MPGEPRQSPCRGWKFLALVLLAYGLSGVCNPEATLRALTFFKQVFGQILPVLALVFALLLVRTHGNRLALGRGEALKILVEEGGDAAAG
ncbi:MAG: hypothetical protein ACU837_03260 [Gammaproteobacteria bacterium]